MDVNFTTMYREMTGLRNNICDGKEELFAFVLHAVVGISGILNEMQQWFNEFIFMVNVTCLVSELHIKFYDG